MEEVIQQTSPNPEQRFGHTITMINKDKAILFGGAVGDGVYRITNDTFAFDCQKNTWTQLRPKNNEDCPSPRAAHASTGVEANQLVIFGGAHSHGNLVDNELYLLKLSNSEANGKWVKVPVKGEKPASRYGHSMVFFKPFILVVSGNILNEPCDEVWYLSIDKSPFYWKKIEFNYPGQRPCPRVYQATSIWKSPEKGDMVLMFGGRNKTGQALNDLWGLRRHNSGVWDWIMAPTKNDKPPTNRYQHQMICSQNLAILIGGRNNSNSSKNEISIDVYNLPNAEWHSFQGANRFRHVSWISYQNLYTHGGFENKKPNLPISTLTRIDLKELFSSNSDLQKNIEQPFDKNKKFLNRYQLNSEVVVGPYNTESGLTHTIPTEELQQESIKLLEQDNVPLEKKANHQQNLYTTVLKYFLKPLSWNQGEDQIFPMKSEIIIALCNEVIKLLKKEKMVLKLNPGVKVFGSLHGQFGDLIRFFDKFGVPDINASFKKSDVEAMDYLFLGNYVDRGKNSLEVICTLFALKLKYPDSIFLLRGSHEDREINQYEGLGTECQLRIEEDIQNPKSVFNKINEVFEYMSLAAILDQNILCVHAGIGENLTNPLDLDKIKKPLKIDHKNLQDQQMKLVLDVLWSDPVSDINESQNQKNQFRDYIAKGKVVRYGTKRIKDFLHQNDLQIIIRSHECVMEGVEPFGDTNLYTVFSCTNYGGTAKNKAAFFDFHALNRELTTKIIDFQPGTTYWYQKQQQNYFGDEALQNFNPKNRPVTPPRPPQNRYNYK